MMSLKPIGTATAIPLPAAPTDSGASFEAELASVLKHAIAGRKGMVFHVQGASINGVVKEVRDGAVLVSNHENARILIRFDRIDAVEGN